MTERRDDTTNGAAESREPRGYYYDDATGYETYTPEDDEGEREDEGKAPRTDSPPESPEGAR